MKFWTYEKMQCVMGGRWLHPSNAQALPEHPQVVTDSRAVTTGSVFFARRGEQVDGHAFVHQAMEAGASLLVVDREDACGKIDDLTVPTLCVKDSTESLGLLGAAYRKTLRGRVVAITGSAGKTTTKQILQSLLRIRFNGHASPKSFNNAVGVPLTLLSAKPTDEFIIVEVGTNAPGEIASLSRLVEPNVAVITNIGRAHFEGLGNLAGVLREKASMLSHLSEGGLAIVNADATGIEDYRKVSPNLLTFGRGENCDLRITDVKTFGDGIEFEVNNRVRYQLPLLGEHNASNALAAIAVAKHFHLDDDQIAKGLAKVTAAEMRLRVERYGTGDMPLILLNDCYNANPESVAASLRVLSQYPTAHRRIAILGDMAELGESGPELHREVGETLAASAIDSAILVGRLSMFIAESLAREWKSERIFVIPSWDDQTVGEITSRLQPGDTVLLKASRSMQFERIVPVIAEKFGQARHAASPVGEAGG